jgi:hypothetical protein
MLDIRIIDSCSPNLPTVTLRFCISNPRFDGRIWPSKTNCIAGLTVLDVAFAAFAAPRAVRRSLCERSWLLADVTYLIPPAIGWLNGIGVALGSLPSVKYTAISGRIDRYISAPSGPSVCYKTDVAVDCAGLSPVDI